MDCGLFPLSDCTFKVFLFTILMGARFASTLSLATQNAHSELNSAQNRVIFSGIDCGIFSLYSCTFKIFLFTILVGARFASALSLATQNAHSELNSAQNCVVFSGIDCGLFPLSDCTFKVFLFTILMGARFASTLSLAT